MWSFTLESLEPSWAIAENLTHIYIFPVREFVIIIDVPVDSMRRVIPQQLEKIMNTCGKKAQNEKPLVGFFASPEEYEFISKLKKQTGFTNRTLIVEALKLFSSQGGTSMSSSS